MGYKILTRAQIGIETTQGTAVTPTRQLVGLLGFDDERTRERRVDERTGRISDAMQVNDMAYLSKWKYTAELSVDELPYFMAMAYDGSLAPTGPTTGSYNWSLQPSGFTSFPALKTATLVHGDDTGAMGAAGCFVTSIAITGADNKALMLEVEGLGRRYQTRTLAALTHPTTEVGKSLLTLWTVDDDFATMNGGTPTEQVGNIYDFTWKLMTGAQEDFTQSGSLDMSDIGRNAPVCTLEYTAKWNSEGVAERSDYNLRTMRYITITNSGSLIPGGSVQRRVRMRLGLIYDTFKVLGSDKNGFNTIKASGTATDDGTFLFSLVAINALSAL